MNRLCALSLIFITGANALNALTIEQIASRMAAIDCYADSAVYEVLLPNHYDPVSYTLQLESTAAPADTLAPCNYFVGWQLPTPSGISDGFTAYFNGTHYRLREERLQEYHYEWNPEVFAPGGDISRGVQTQAQFADLLPQVVARHFMAMTTDSTYIYKVTADTLVDGRRSTVIEGVRRAAGYDGTEYTYILDHATLLPRRFEFEYNPGQIGEQSVTVKYANAATPSNCRIDEESVIARRPEAFEKYRESTFSLESLPGTMLPRIASRTSTGERYLHERGQAFAVPTIFVFADASVGTTPALIQDVRQAVDMLPQQVDIVWAFINHRADDVEDVIPSIRPGEHLLVGARAAARDCGVGAVTPVLIFASPNGKVSDYILGYNQSMPSIVLQKASLACQ